MPYIDINTGSFDNDSNADKIRVAFNKAKSMFAELYTMFGDIVFDLDDVGVANVVQIPYNPIGNDYTEAENIANSINNCPFVIDVPQGQLIFVRCVIGNAGQTPGIISFVTVTYMILNGSGTYGWMQPQIPPDRVLKIEQQITSETNNYDLGDIGGADIWDYVNFNGPYAVSGTTTFTTSEKVYVFVGAEGLYGIDNLQTTAANFIEITEGAVVSNSDLPPKQITVDTYTLADSDLYRQLYFTEEDTQLTIPDAYTSTNASYYFRVFFAGSGSHSIIDSEATVTYNFEQGDFVLCEKKFGLNGWIVKKVGGGGGGTALETIRAWISPYDEDLEVEQYPGFVVTPAMTMVRAWVVCTEAPTGDDIEIDMVNQTDSNTTLASFTISANTNKSNVVTTFLDTVSEGDVIIFDCTQIGSSNAGAGLQLYLEIIKS